MIWPYKRFRSDLSFPKTFPVNFNDIYVFAVQPWGWVLGIIVVRGWEKIKKDKQLRNGKFYENNNHSFTWEKKLLLRIWGRVHVCISTGQESGAYWTLKCVIMPRHVVWPKKEVRNKNSYFFCIVHVNFKRCLGETTVP